MLWLCSKNIKSTRPPKTMSEIWLRPLPIFKKAPVKTSTIPNRHEEPPPPIIIEEEEEWEVPQMLDSKLKR
ncbi:hypothetical protein O181_089260 [Austropuccinia psidii MF-1]|uniref:Uncharacterized protein n=1 Tax=Austropuccinia psidii MF-1 TaxID=1389203 RepID=A0A9Q3P5G9_9BASI|nr:hypothetical protein [Austropuccinia psidii MF-1]